MSNKVYYNISIPWNENSGCDACSGTVQYDSGEPILGRGSDYYASIINFSLPVSGIPLMFADIEPFPNTDVNKTVFKIALEYDGNVATENVIYYSNDLTQSPPAAPTATNTTVDRTFYHAIYSYTKFMNMVNTAYEAAFTALPSTPVGSIAPKLIFNPSTNRFSLIVHPSFYATNLANPVRVFMSYKLYQFFIGFDVVRVGYQNADGRDFRFEVIENYNDFPAGNPGEIEVGQDYSTISNWNCLRSLQLRGPMLNTADEYVPSARAGSDGRSAKAAILASFNPIYDNSPGGAAPRSQISFSLNSAYRLIDIITSSPLTKISLSVWWSDEQNNTYPLVLNYRELIQVKLCFHLKESYMG